MHCLVHRWNVMGQLREKQMDLTARSMQMRSIGRLRDGCFGRGKRRGSGQGQGQGLAGVTAGNRPRLHHTVSHRMAATHSAQPTDPSSSITRRTLILLHLISLESPADQDTTHVTHAPRWEVRSWVDRRCAEAGR